MGFGKYSGKTYEQVLKEDGKYCEWITATASGSQSSVYLRRFARWLAKNKDNRSTRQTKLIIKQTPLNRGYKTKVESTEEEELIPTSAASSSSEAMVGELTQLMHGLMTEVRELKEERAATVPRKVAIKEDVTMGKP